MGRTFRRVIPCMDTNDLTIAFGFAAGYVRVVTLNDGQEFFWFQGMANDTCIARVAAGDRTVTSGSGLKLVSVADGKSIDAGADGTAVESGQWNEINGILITSDAALLSDDALLLIEASEMDVPLVRAVHDGGDNCNTYVQDASLDLMAAGVSSGWIVYNQTNGNYAYVGEVQKPSGKTKYCRATLLTSKAGSATTAADIDDDDVIFFYPDWALGYPLSDLGVMT